MYESHINLQYICLYWLFTLHKLFLNIHKPFYSVVLNVKLGTFGCEAKSFNSLSIALIGGVEGFSNFCHSSYCVVVYESTKNSPSDGEKIKQKLSGFLFKRKKNNIFSALKKILKHLWAKVKQKNENIEKPQNDFLEFFKEHLDLRYLVISFKNSTFFYRTIKFLEYS